MTDREMSDPSEADVKAAQEKALRRQAERLYEYVTTQYELAFSPAAAQRRLRKALASARAEGEAAGAAKEREAAVRWLWEQWDQHEHSHPAVCIERGDHLRALTPEGKR